MRVLLIHQAFVPPTEAGGTRHYELAQHCLKLGHQFVIVASSLSYLTGQRTTTARGLISRHECDGIQVLRAYAYPSLHRSIGGRLLSFLSFMVSSIWGGLRVGPIDLVMGTSPPIFQAVSAWLVARLRRRPYLLEIRDLWPEFMIDMGVLKNRWLIGAARWLERFLYRHADHLVVNSPAYRDYLMQRGIPAQKVSLIPNGVDPGMFDPEASGAALREKLHLDGKFLVVYAGALGLANDLPTLLRAADRLRDQAHVHFLLVGDGMERSNAERMAREMNLLNVTFAGAQPKASMRVYLAAADACVATLLNIAMYRTTYPNKIFDYMAAGRPIILAIDGVIRDVVEAAGGGVFVPPGNDAALADAVRSLAANPAAGRAMGRAGRQYVVAHFHRARQAEQFAELLPSVGRL